MPSDLAHQFNPSTCQADFSYSITPHAVEIQDTGKGKKSVADDLEEVLRKIEYWHQGSIARYRITDRRDDKGVAWTQRKMNPAMLTSTTFAIMLTL